MLVVFKLAFRNVFRNKRRTLLTLLAIMFGCVALFLVGGYVNDVFIKIREQVIHSKTGHFQVYRKGHEEFALIDPAKYTLTGDEYAKIEEIISSDARTDFVTPRLPFTGLVSTGPSTVTLVASGVDPVREAKLGEAVAMTAGSALSAGSQGEILLGKGLAQGIGVKVGDNLSMLGQTFDGMMNGMNVTVKGIFETGIKAYDETAGQLSLASAQAFLNAENVDAVVVILKETKDTEAVVQSVSEKIKAAGVPFEVKTWDELDVSYKKIVQQLNMAFKMIQFVVIVIVVLGIANTMIMSVYERVQEVGTLMAIGTRRGKVLSMFLAEGLALGLIGGVLGLLVSIAVKLAIDAAGGIPMPAPPGYTRGYYAFIAFVPSVAIMAFLTSVCTALVSSIFPAYRASRLEVVAALRHI